MHLSVGESSTKSCAARGEDPALKKRKRLEPGRAMWVQTIEEDEMEKFRWRVHRGGEVEL